MLETSFDLTSFGEKSDIIDDGTYYWISAYSSPTTLTRVLKSDTTQQIIYTLNTGENSAFRLYDDGTDIWIGMSITPAKIARVPKVGWPLAPGSHMTYTLNATDNRCRGISGDANYVYATTYGNSPGRLSIIPKAGWPLAPATHMTYNLNPGENNLVSITNDGTYIWAVCSTWPNKLVRIPSTSWPLAPGSHLSYTLSAGSYNYVMYDDGTYIWIPDAAQSGNLSHIIRVPKVGWPLAPLSDLDIVLNAPTGQQSRAIAGNGTYIWHSTNYGYTTKLLQTDPTNTAAWSEGTGGGWTWNGIMIDDNFLVIGYSEVTTRFFAEGILIEADSIISSDSTLGLDVTISDSTELSFVAVGESLDIEFQGQYLDMNSSGIISADNSTDNVNLNFTNDTLQPIISNNGYYQLRIINSTGVNSCSINGNSTYQVKIVNFVFDYDYSVGNYWKFSDIQIFQSFGTYHNGNPVTIEFVDSGSLLGIGIQYFSFDNNATFIANSPGPTDFPITGLTEYSVLSWYGCETQINHVPTSSYIIISNFWTISFASIPTLQEIYNTEFHHYPGGTPTYWSEQTSIGVRLSRVELDNCLIEDGYVGSGSLNSYLLNYRPKDATDTIILYGNETTSTISASRGPAVWGTSDIIKVLGYSIYNYEDAEEFDSQLEVLTDIDVGSLTAIGLTPIYSPGPVTSKIIPVAGVSITYHIDLYMTIAEFGADTNYLLYADGASSFELGPSSVFNAPNESGTWEMSVDSIICSNDVEHDSGLLLLNKAGDTYITGILGTLYEIEIDPVNTIYTSNPTDSIYTEGQISINGILDATGSGICIFGSVIFGAAGSYIGADITNVIDKNASHICWNKVAGATFTSNGKLVEFTGDDDPVNPYQILGDNDWGDLHIIVSNVCTYAFEATKGQTVDDEVIIGGTPGSPLSLISTIPGTMWKFIIGANQNLAYLIVDDSDASLGTTAVAFDSSPASLPDPNINWFFATAGMSVWIPTTGLPQLASDPSTWLGGSVPPLDGIYVFGLIGTDNCIWDLGIIPDGSIIITENYGSTVQLDGTLSTFELNYLTIINGHFDSGTAKLIEYGDLHLYLDYVLDPLIGTGDIHYPNPITKIELTKALSNDILELNQDSILYYTKDNNVLPSGLRTNHMRVSPTRSKWYNYQVNGV